MCDAELLKWLTEKVCQWEGQRCLLNHLPEYSVKVGISRCGNLQTISTDKWATSKSTQLSTKVWVKPLLLLENDLKLKFEAPFFLL